MRNGPPTSHSPSAALARAAADGRLGFHFEKGC
jgi:hypothetical protein